MTEHVLRHTVLPALTPEMTAAAVVLEGSGWFAIRRHERSESVFQVRTPEAIVTTWVLRGLDHDLNEAARQLMMARLGLGKWKEIVLDLRGLPPGSEVSPMDYCPEIKPEYMVILKDDARLDEVQDLPCYWMTLALADMLSLGEAEFYFSFDLPFAEHMLEHQARRITELTQVRDALRSALPQTWPVATEACWTKFLAELAMGRDAQAVA